MQTCRMQASSKGRHPLHHLPGRSSLSRSLSFNLAPRATSSDDRHLIICLFSMSLNISR
jgi:hypothetical protein